jgi:hypothetical protein
MAQSQNVPDEFEKVIKDFIKDIKTTFPEYSVFINKWWKEDSHFASIEDEPERKEAIEKARKNSIQFIFKFCLRKFPPRFFDILYQNNDIFKEDAEVDTEFLPQIHFKNLWECDITDKTRETIWKYLQLIMFSIVNCVENRDAFGDTTAEMFESMNTDDFRSKLQETLSDIQQIFEQNQGKSEEGEEGEGQESDENNSANPSHGLPNANDIYSHVSGMLGGKLGQLAKEIAEETAESFNLDTDNMTNVNDVLQGLMKNPSKMMNLVKNVGQKLDSRIKSGDIKESELISEASDMIKKMKDIPGMGNIQDILSKMGMGGRGSKVNLNAMQEQLDRNMKAAQTRERMRNNVDKKQQQQQPKPVPPPSQKPAYTDEELVTIMNNATPEKTEKTEKKDKKKKAHKKK